MTIRRKTNTDIHIKIRNLIEQLGFLYIEEYSLPPYRLDFWLPEAQIGIEADSEYWHSERKDRARDEFIDGIYRVKIIRCGYKTKLEDLRQMIEDACK